MLGGWTMQGGQTKQGELFIALTHEDHKPIIFDRVLKAGNSVLLTAKMVIKNPEEVNAAIVNGKQSKEYFHRVTGHAGHHLLVATANYYKVDLTGDTVYIKTQVFRLLRYYSPAPRKIARSDWATQNITHNMTSSLKQPYGVHSH